MTGSIFEDWAQTGAFLRAIIQTATDGIVIIDQRGVMIAINQSVADLFGYRKEELEGKHISMLMPEPHRSSHDTYVRKYMDTGIAQIIGIGREVEGVRSDGTLFPARLAVSEVLAGGKRYFAGFIHDLSDVKEAEERIMAMNEELERKVQKRTDELQDAVNRLLTVNKKLGHEVEEREIAQDALVKAQGELRDALQKEKELNELKSRFVSMASHEFRTPLTTILSSTALLRRYTETEQQDKRVKHLDRIESSVKHLTGILNDFLSISKIEEGRILVQPERCNLSMLCEEVREDFEGLLREGQRIQQDGEGRDIWLETDKFVMKGILINLLSNASKYSKPGTLITLHLKDLGDRVHVAIEDEGMGIPESEQKHLFSRFFRASNVMNIQGTGLGLNIVNGYVEMLGGEIQFESTEGKGSIFKVIIPKELI